MPVYKTTVFIASRFAEFAELRRELRERINTYPKLNLAAIDLNDGSVSSRPPLEVCLANVRRADLMILLLGETYGTLAPGKPRSYTHLEYLEAACDDSDTRVLAFGIGPSYADGHLRLSADAKLAAWQAQVKSEHTMGYFDGTLSMRDTAARIMEHLLQAFYEMRFGPADDDELGDEPTDASSGLDANREVESLEMRFRRRRGDDDSDPDALSADERADNPARVAAREQCREARDAINVGALAIAIHHYRKALELRPLDLEANYWLARLYLAIGRKRHQRESVRMLERAARIEERAGRDFHASECYQLMARTLGEADEPAEAVLLAQRATEITPTFGRAWLELARANMLTGNADAAREALRRAILLYFPLFAEARRDRILRPLQAWVERWAGKLLAEEVERATGMLDRERHLSRLHGSDPVEMPEVAKVRDRARASGYANGSLRRQHRLVCDLLARMRQAQAEAASRSGALAKQLEDCRQHIPGLEHQVADQRNGSLILNAAVGIIGVFIAVLVARAGIVDGVFAGLVTAAVVVVLVIRGLAPLRARREALRNGRAELARISGELDHAHDAERAAAATLHDAWPIWCESLGRSRRGVLYRSWELREAGGCVALADAELRKAESESRASWTLLDGVVTPPDQRRLFRVTHSDADGVILSEPDAYRTGAR